MGSNGYLYRQQQVKDLLRTDGLEILHFTKIFPSTHWDRAQSGA